MVSYQTLVPSCLRSLARPPPPPGTCAMLSGTAQAQAAGVMLQTRQMRRRAMSLACLCASCRRTHRVAARHAPVGLAGVIIGVLVPRNTRLACECERRRDDQRDASTCCGGGDERSARDDSRQTKPHTAVMKMTAVVSTANRLFHRHLSPAPNFFCRLLQMHVCTTASSWHFVCSMEIPEA